VKHAPNIKMLNRQPVEPPTETTNEPAAAPAETASSPVLAAIGSYRPDRRTVLMALGALLAIFALWKAIDWWTTGRFEVSTNNAYVRAEITSISPRIQGYVSKIAVTDNQAVQAGDLLIVLENADGAAKLAEAEAALAQAKSDAAQARAQLAAQRNLLVSAQTQLQAQSNKLNEFAAGKEAAAADAKLAQDELERDRDLAAKGHYPQARVTTAETQTEAAKAALDQASAAVVSQRSQIALARAGISRAESDVMAAEAAVSSADARVAAAEARVASAKLDTNRAEIRAPIAGIVANKTVSEGQLLNPGQQTMAIVPVEKAYVVANFKETQVARMHAGQPVELTVDAYRGLKVHGTVDSIAPASGAQFSLIPQDTATGNFTKIVQRIPVRIALSPDALETGLMRPGLSVEATVSVKPARG
jgi:membrane fusion protein (multidrug efflux system)